MSVKLLKAVVLLSITLLFVVKCVNCKDSELLEELAGTEIPLTEKIARYAGSLARTDWDNLISADLNGYYQTLVYKVVPQDFDKLPGFNTTKLTTVALLGHFALILSGIYFLSLLPERALNGLLPRIDLRNPFGRRRRRRFRHRPQPLYHDYDYNEYEDDYEYSYRYGPPRDHHRRLIRHGPPLFNHRMVEANPEAKAQRRNKFNSMNSMDSDDINTISYEETRHPSKLVKRQATTSPPWWAQVMNFATGPFDRFQRSYSQLFDHYGDFWRFRLSNGETTQNKEGSTTRGQPNALIQEIKSFNKGVNNIVTKIVKGVERLDKGFTFGQRRSWSSNTRPQRQRHHQGGRPRRRFRHGRNRPQVEENYGPPPSAPSEQVVEALHE